MTLHIECTDERSQSKQLRDSKAQNDYRQNSKSKHKSEQHVAHYISLDIASFINSIHEDGLLCQYNILKPIINQSDNFRMVNVNTNLSNHKRIDNKLLQIWKVNFLQNTLKNNQIATIINNVLLSVASNKSNTSNISNIEQLFRVNPTVLLIILQKILNNDNILNIRIKNHEPKNIITRAISQTKRFQNLGFPNEYLEMARFLYSLLYDNKGNKIWDDRRNKQAFSLYLKQQKHNASYLLSYVETIDCSFALGLSMSINSNVNLAKTRDKDDQDSKTNQQKTDSKDSKDNKDSSKSKLKASDDKKEKKWSKEPKGRPVHFGPRGGSYYLDKNGKKQYLSKTEKDKITDSVPQIVENEKSGPKQGTDVIDRIDSQGRAVFRGKRGGLYYFAKNGRKVYVKK